MKIPNAMLLIVAALYSLAAAGSVYMKGPGKATLIPGFVWLL
jgi:hypothetical protein